MYKNLIALLFLMSITLLSCSDGQTQATTLPAEEFAEKINQLPDAPVLDVRTPEEFAKGHLPTAKNVDWNGDDFQQQLTAFDKSQPIFVYCLSGGRSSSAIKQMRKAGFTEVYELKGGIMKWRAANLPEVGNNTSKSAGMSTEQFAQLTDSDKLVLIDFYADWCAPCRKMKPYLEEISTEMADSVVVIRINADDNQQLCKDLQIDALPVLQLYKNKTLVWTNTGYIEKEEVVKQLL